MMKSFAEIATSLMAEYMEELGFRICSRTSDSVGFESSKKRVYILLGRDYYSYEVDGEIRLESSMHEAARFSEIARMLNKPLGLPYPIRDAEKLGVAIGAAGNFVRNELEGVLSGSDEGMGKLLHSVEEFRRVETLRYTISPLRRQAEEAWKRRDFLEIVQAYSQMEDAMNDSERRRLEYAKSRLDSTRKA